METEGMEHIDKGKKSKFLKHVFGLYSFREPQYAHWDFGLSTGIH